jgi:hypothetical protein
MISAGDCKVKVATARLCLSQETSMMARKKIRCGRVREFLAGVAVASLISALHLVDLAQALSPVTFASGNGNNSNDCLTPATACREIGDQPLSPGALSKTDSGGTIHVLPGAYKSFHILGPINILADQGQASIHESIAAPSGLPLGLASIHIYQSARVRIRGLTFGGKDSGIAIGSQGGGAPTVYIENCTFNPGTGGVNAGVEMVTASGASELYVSASTFQGPGQAVLIKPSSGASARVVLNDLSIENANTGVSFDARATNGVNRIAINNTTIGNGGGLILFEDANGSTSVAVENTNIVNGGTALLANGPTISVRVQNSMIIGNTAGLSLVSSAQAISHGGNVLFGNGTNGAFTSRVAPQ